VLKASEGLPDAHHGGMTKCPGAAAKFSFPDGKAPMAASPAYLVASLTAVIANSRLLWDAPWVFYGGKAELASKRVMAAFK
jgi:hypothetical protein